MTPIKFKPARRRVKPAGKCQSRYCRNDAIIGRKWCPKCRSRQYKERHPLRYYFNLLRCHAYRRKKHFSLSFECYAKAVTEANFTEELRGRTKCCYSIDAIDPKLGYRDGNIQVLSISDNASKKDNPDWMSEYDPRYVHEAPTEPEPDVAADNCPF